MRAPVLKMRNAKPGENGLHPVLGFRPAETESLQPEGDVVAHDRQDDLVLWILENEADRLQHRLGIRHGVEPVDRHLALARLGQSVDQPREGGLAGAVEADHTDAPLGQ